MKRIIGVRFKRLGKIYFFDPKWLEVKKGESVIVETAQGEEIAEVVVPNRMIEEEKVVAPLKKVLRLASPRDIKHAEECKKKEKEAFELCNKKIKEHNLQMTLTDVEYKFDNSKILFYFTADGRVDFRDLVKDLAAIYKTRIELRQIGVRDEVKRIGGNGVCGRELCCCSFLSDFECDKCISCGACAAACPVGCISQGDTCFVIDESACIECGTCAGVCPVEAPELAND